ncbi:hypothetical protein ASZ90_005642 [hydrocarbon metagenome]|uniref:Uncharacterized protein n=1 Tax=hydrocarbon metagenome TaxID=938273 RepID=A0A0W8FUV3_9ZZZZ
MADLSIHFWFHEQVTFVIWHKYRQYKYYCSEKFMVVYGFKNEEKAS